MYYLTAIEAIDPEDGEVKVWTGPRIWADSPEQAREYCIKNGLAFCVIVGECDSQINYEEEIIWLN